MIRFCLPVIFLLFGYSSFSQDTISVSQVENIIRFLASDSMKGRGNGSPQLNNAAQFIASEFMKDSLLYIPGQSSFLNPFLTHSDPETGDTGMIKLFNVVGLIKGKTKPTELIIFSAHYDHIGMQDARRDSIFNGANDNASGTTALLTLAHYFALRNDNSRTLVFCAFSGEELGLRGSGAFVKKINCDSIVAMINIEMIGRYNVAGKNAFYITGAKHSNLVKILKKNLQNTRFKIVPEPPEERMLFERSDNLPFVVKGVPAHSLMCSDDNDPCYHKLCDEVDRINFENMTNVIRAIALSVRSLVDGTDKPTRIQFKQSLDY